MPKLNLKVFLDSLKSSFQKIDRKKLPHFDQKKLGVCIGKACLFITSWWHVLLLSFLSFIFLYYPIGGLIISQIDKTTDYEINKAQPQQSATIEMAAFLVNREVNENLWTPNLPFFFPSYFLDNMPSFQLGIISALSNVSSALASRLDSPITDKPEELRLKNAAKFLKYDGHIWMFSSKNSFTPAPSAHSQYRKARKELIKFNQDLSSGYSVFYKSPLDLAFFLQRINKDLYSSLDKIETQIREESSSFIDFKADNTFYYTQGKLYTYYLLTKALGVDYKQIIVNKNAYRLWTKSLKAMEDGSTLDTLYIRNGKLSSLTAPNHLQYLAFYTLKIIDTNQRIIKLLEKNAPEKE